MKITIKQKPSTDGKTARLYLDICDGSKRNRRVLDLFVYIRTAKRFTPEQNKHNTDALTSAEKERNRVETELLNGGTLEDKRKSITIEELTRIYCANKKSKDNTQQTFAQMLKHIDADERADKLTTDVLNELYKQIERADVSTNTALLYRAKLDAVVRYGIKKGYCKSGILDKTDDKPKADHHEREYLSADELRILVDDYNTTGKNWQRVFLFSCFTGLRYSDVVALTWGDIKDNEIRLTTRKTNTFTTIPLNDKALSLLPTRKKDGAVFRVPDVSSIRKTLLSWATANGIKKSISFHTARHTFATLSLLGGAELYTISKLLGHHNITTTQIYADVVDATKRQAVDALNDIFKD